MRELVHLLLRFSELLITFLLSLAYISSMALLRSIFGCVSSTADNGGASGQRPQPETLDTSHSSSSSKSDNINDTTAVSGCGAVRATPPPLPLPPSNYKLACSSLFSISDSAAVAEQCVLEKYLSRPKQIKEAVHYLSHAQRRPSRRVLFIEGRVCTYQRTFVKEIMCRSRKH